MEPRHAARADQPAYGDCPVHVLTPGEGDGPWPAAITYVDAGSVRPAMLDMAQRLADAGRLPDLFYRYGPYGPLVPAEVFKGETCRQYSVR